MTTVPTLSIEMVPIGDLRPDPFNPRRIADAELEALTRSLREFGFVSPVVARSEDRTIIGGHQRLVAARRLGHTEVPVVFVDLSQEQARLLNLALNKISGDWDQDLLGRMLKDLKDIPSVDLSLTGFADEELDQLMRRLEVRERSQQAERFDFAAALEAAQKTKVTKPGDLWRLGEHRLLCTDATNPDSFIRLLGSRKAALCFSDPPYNVNYGSSTPIGSKRRTIANDDLGVGFRAFLEAACRQILAHTDGAVYLCMSSSELHTLQAAFVAAGGHWSTFLIWAKDTFTVGRSDYQRQYEPILYGWRAGAKHYWCGARDQGDVWQVDKPRESPLHPTMKPLALIERAIHNSSREGDLVLDPFLGSGSTLIAAERTGRVCYGMELDPAYCDVIIYRWESFTGEKAQKAAPTA